MDLTNRSALVMGGGSGLGLATAALLSTKAAHVVVADNAEHKREAVEALGSNVSFVLADISNTDDVIASVTTADEKAPLGAAVATAAIVARGRILHSGGTETMSVDEFDRMMRVNLTGSAAVVIHASKAMAQHGSPGEERGIIVLTSSIAAMDGGHFGYAASKAGVAGMTLSAAHGLAPYGVRVMCIAPGVFHTPLVPIENGISGALESVIDGIPFPQRLGEPEEYAALVGHIVDNQMLNGEVIRLDAAVRLPRLRPGKPAV